MFNNFFSSAASKPAEDESDAGSDIEIVDNVDYESGNEFLDESIEKSQMNQQQSSVQTSDQDYLHLMEQSETALTNSFGIFGFGESEPISIVGKDAGTQMPFAEQLENMEDEAKNEDKVEDEAADEKQLENYDTDVTQDDEDEMEEEAKAKDEDQVENETKEEEKLENMENEEKDEEQLENNDENETKDEDHKLEDEAKDKEEQFNGKTEKKALSKLVAGFDCSNGKITFCGWLDPATNVMNCLSCQCQNGMENIWKKRLNFADPLDVAESKSLANSVKEICSRIENLHKMETERIGHGVFAIPDHWNIGQRREFMSALKSFAGFEKIHLLNGQTAVALGFCRQKQLAKIEKHGFLWIINSSPRSLETCFAKIHQNKLTILGKNEFNAFEMNFNFDEDNFALALQHFGSKIDDFHVLILGNYRIDYLALKIQNELGINDSQIHALGLDANSLCVKGCLYYSSENVDTENGILPIQIVELLCHPIYCHYLEANTQTMIFPKFSQYPCQKSITFYSVFDDQQTFQMKFKEDVNCALEKLDGCSAEDGDHLLHNMCISLFNDNAHTFGKHFLRLSLEIDANGIFHVSSEKSGRQSNIDE